MKKIIICLLALFSFSTSVFPQTMSKELVYFVINQYVAEKYDTSVVQNVYIRIINGEKLDCCTSGKTKIYFFGATNERKFYKKIMKSDGVFHTLYFRYWRNDTTDFNFRKCHVDRDDRYYCISEECGGTLGYIPYARFVFAKEEKKWVLVSREKLIKDAVLNLPNAFNVQYK